MFDLGGTPTTQERCEAFLVELSELTKKHAIEIGGCGCDGSPWLWDHKKNKFMGDNLSWNEASGKYKLGEE